MSRAHVRVARRLQALGLAGRLMADQHVESLDGWAGEVALERAAQDMQWGGPAADDSRLPRQWAEDIDKQLRKLEDELQGAPTTSDFEFFRDRMVKVAALAVAAMQAHDRWLDSKGEAEEEGCGQCPACLRRKKALEEGSARDGNVHVVEVRDPAQILELLSQLGLGGPTPRR